MQRNNHARPSKVLTTTSKMDGGCSPQSITGDAAIVVSRGVVTAHMVNGRNDQRIRMIPNVRDSGGPILRTCYGSG